MVWGKNTNGLVILLLLLLTVSVNASLTNNIKSNNNTVFVDSENGSNSLNKHEMPILTGLIKFELTDSVTKYNSNSVNYAYNSPYNIQARSLPPGPRTLILVLCGFVCISMIKDRKVWLRALSGIIWAGQTSLAFLPYIASHFISNDTFRGKNANVDNESCEHETDWNLQKDSKNKRYIGLLRRLAGIPECIRIKNSGAIYLRQIHNQYDLVFPYFYSILENHISNTSLKSFLSRKYSAFKNKRRTLVTPITIFACLARGPPIYDCCRNFPSDGGLMRKILLVEGIFNNGL